MVVLNTATFLILVNFLNITPWKIKQHQIIQLTRGEFHEKNLDSLCSCFYGISNY